ncbi:MAG: hypothetical protein WAW00_01870 [Candidatus Moraniibacteriota bacterium]
MYKIPEVPEIFVAMLLAEFTGPMHPIGMLKKHKGLPFINDFSPRWDTVKDTDKQLPKLWLTPQTIITTKGEGDAEDKANALVMRECPPHRGWSNHWQIVNNISIALQKYLGDMRPSGKHPLNMYLINCIGLLYDKTGLLERYNFSTASSGIDEYDAYDYFKEALLDEQSFFGSYWVGGTACVTQIPAEQLLYWKDTWAPRYILHRCKLEATTLVH